MLGVHNKGPAIPKKLIPKLFDLFVQAKDRGTDGMGLGLFIAKEIVVSHGGWIDVRSTDAEGTTFSVHLPEVAQRRKSHKSKETVDERRC